MYCLVHSFELGLSLGCRLQMFFKKLGGGRPGPDGRYARTPMSSRKSLIKKTALFKFLESS